MTGFSDSRAMLGIDPTSRGLAFAYFAGGELLDWGTRGRIGREPEALDAILSLCPADLLILEDGAAPSSQRRPRVRRVLRALERRARVRGIDVLKVMRDEVRRSWLQRGLSAKYAVASAIADRFPVLQVILPRLRKVYRSEEARTEIFDAASLVLHVCARERESLGEEVEGLSTDGRSLPTAAAQSQRMPSSRGVWPQDGQGVSSHAS